MTVPNYKAAQEKTLRAAFVFAILSLVTLGFIILGIPFLLLGIFVLILEGVFWVSITGILMILIASVIGWKAYRWFTECKKRFESPRKRNQVFISYRTAEHSKYAEKLAEILQNEGIKVFFARPDQILMNRENLLTVFRLLGLFQIGGLDADLQKALIESDAMVYFVPILKRKIGSWRNVKDTFDNIISQILFRSGVTPTTWRYFWYMGMFGRSVAPAPRMFNVISWQSWELAIASQINLNVIKLKISKEIENNKEYLTICQPETLETDFKQKILPKLRNVIRKELKIEGSFPIIAFAGVLFYTLKVIAILSVVFIGMFLILRAFF